MPARPPSDFPVEALIDPAKTVADAMRRGDWTNPLLAYDLYEDGCRPMPSISFALKMAWFLQSAMSCASSKGEALETDLASSAPPAKALP